MRIFKIKSFNKWAKKAGLTDSSLRHAVEEIEQGLVEANLGGNLYKKRISTPVKGKKGGFRTLLAYKKGHIVFFMYGFEKGEKENVSNQDEEDLKNFAKVYLNFDEDKIQAAVNIGSLVEVQNNA